MVIHTSSIYGMRFPSCCCMHRLCMLSNKETFSYGVVCHSAASKSTNFSTPPSAHTFDTPASPAALHMPRFATQNCRGFWANDVLNVHGLPPDTSEREQHKRWER
jgi:hypothetical protein